MNDVVREMDAVDENAPSDGSHATTRRSSVTLTDVAQRANVSLTTASLFFNGRENVCGEATAARLRKAAADLNYSVNRVRRPAGSAPANPRPSAAEHDAPPEGSQAVTSLSARAAQSAAQPRAGTYVLGVCIPHDEIPGASTPTSLTQAYPNTFLEQVWRGINHVADVEDCRILQYPRRVREGESIEPFLYDSHVNGLIMVTDPGDPRPGLLAAAGLPVLLVGRSSEIPEGCGAVFALESNMVDLALSHLRQLGHRRIAFISGPMIQNGDGGDEIVKRRLELYSAWMQARGFFAPELTPSGEEPGSIETAVSDAVTRLMSLANPPTAIFCANDAIAVAACRVAAASGLTVPDDLSIIGVDNSVYGAENKPSISSVEIPYEQVGIQAVVQLTRMLEGAPAAACRMAIAVTNLVPRESTGPVRAT